MIKADPIRHVVQLILENRSFDQMLGSLKTLFPELDGVDMKALKSNADIDGRQYEQAPTQLRQMLKWDPHHEVPRVAVQLESHNTGFVIDFSQQWPDSTPAARQAIMDFYPVDFCPALHRLAREFTICDRWFSSLPGPTWPNRFFALTGTSNGRVNMPDDGIHKSDLAGYFQQTQTTLFDRLNEQAIHWKVYFHDIPQTTVLNGQRQPHNVARYFHIDQFYTDARGPVSEFPQYCLIEPDFMGFGQNDGHPPHDIMKSEKLIADIYNAIRSNEALWQSTLLIVMYDEHGGFYDHVVPPSAVPPDNAQPSEYDFRQFGVRIPALLVSPFTRARVEHTQFDHTSVLKYLTEKWGLGPLGSRTAAANSIGVALQADGRTESLKTIELTLEQLSPPDPKLEEEAFGATSQHQAALVQLANWLEMEAFEKIPRYVSWAARSTAWLAALANSLLDYAFGAPANFEVSIARPDKLSQPLETEATDKVTKFLMRMKRYAAVGIKTRLNDASLTTDQQQHSLHTLALITGRNFHRESAGVKVENAKNWLSGIDDEKAVAEKPTA